MVKDAEAHADEDRRFRELVDVRNQADGLIHATRKSLGELGEQAGEQEKEEVESAIKALEAAVAGDDKAEIEAKMQTLTEISGKLAERAYQKSQGDDGPGPGRRWRRRHGSGGRRRRGGRRVRGSPRQPPLSGSRGITARCGRFNALRCEPLVPHSRESGCRAPRNTRSRGPAGYEPGRAPG